MVCGASYFGRQRAIENIKKNFSAKAASLVTSTFYGKEAEVQQVEEILLTASFARSRIVLFKDFTALGAAIRTFLFSHYQKLPSGICLIFETDKDFYQLQKDHSVARDSFFSLIMKQASLIRVSSNERQVTLQDFIMSVKKHDLSASLYALERLCETEAKAKILGPQIMGILISHFAYHKNISSDGKEFVYLWQTDRALKEKGIDSRLALETLLVKLFGRL